MESHEKVQNGNRGITLNMLIDAQHALNMRLLLALQNHDVECQRKLTEELREVQNQIDRMRSGGRRF